LENERPIDVSFHPCGDYDRPNFCSEHFWVEIGIIFYVARLHTLGWDGLMNWESKRANAFSTVLFNTTEVFEQKFGRS